MYLFKSSRVLAYPSVYHPCFTDYVFQHVVYIYINEITRVLFHCSNGNGSSGQRWFWDIHCPDCVVLTPPPGARLTWEWTNKSWMKMYHLLLEWWFSLFMLVFRGVSSTVQDQNVKILYTPPKYNIHTKHDGFENVSPFQLWRFWVSMWNFRAVQIRYRHSFTNHSSVQ